MSILFSLLFIIVQTSYCEDRVDLSADKRKIINDIMMSNDISKVDLIASHLNDDDKLVKIAAIEALGFLRSTRHEDIIVDILLKEKDRDIKNSCLIALSYFYPLKNVDKLIDYYGKEKDELLKAQVIRLFAARDVKKLENEMLSVIKSKKSSFDLQVSAIYYLGVIKSTSSIITLKDFLGSDNKMIRLEAIRALGEIGDRSTIELLRARLAEEDDDIKIESAVALAKMGDNFGIKDMYKYVESRNLSHREKALLVIGTVGGFESIKVLEEIMSKTKDENLKFLISFTIEKIKARTKIK